MAGAVRRFPRGVWAPGPGRGVCPLSQLRVPLPRGREPSSGAVLWGGRGQPLEGEAGSGSESKAGPFSPPDSDVRLRCLLSVEGHQVNLPPYPVGHAGLNGRRTASGMRAPGTHNFGGGCRGGDCE